jgi:hypothetical protein
MTPGYHLLLIAQFCGCIGLISNFASALELHRVPAYDNAVWVYIGGKIEQGDSKKVFAYMSALPDTDRVLGFALDSTGGVRYEAKLIAQQVGEKHLGVIVFKDHSCLSECFLLFAAGETKTISPGAWLGLDSGSLPGFGSKATALPQSLTAKIVGTPPGVVTLLSRDELLQMGVQVLGAETVMWVEPPLKPEERITTIRDEYLGCLNRNIMAGILRYMAEGRFAEIEQGFAALGQSGACARFHKDQTVVVLETDSERQLTKVRIKGRPDVYWTLTDSLKK